jgi:hypothetical protein
MAFRCSAVLIKTDPAMKLWLLCFVILFAAAEGLQGIGGRLNLFPGGAWHPLTVLAGIGLAVLSNANALGLRSAPPAADPTPAADPKPAPGQTQDKGQPKPFLTLPNPISSRPKAKSSIKANSISFDLRDDIRDSVRDKGRQPMRKSS